MTTAFYVFFGVLLTLSTSVTPATTSTSDNTPSDIDCGEPIYPQAVVERGFQIAAGGDAFHPDPSEPIVEGSEDAAHIARTFIGRDVTRGVYVTIPAGQVYACGFRGALRAQVLQPEVHPALQQGGHDDIYEEEEADTTTSGGSGSEASAAPHSAKNHHHHAGAVRGKLILCKFS